MTSEAAKVRARGFPVTTIRCPWTGAACDCTHASLVNGLLRPKCQSHLTLATAEWHMSRGRIDPGSDLAREVKRWVAAGRLDHWVGEDDNHPGIPDSLEGGGE